MKRNFVAITLIALFFSIALTGCEKETNTTENINPSLKNLNISDIKVQDGMLCFDSWEQYESVAQSLAEACENYVTEYIDSITIVLGTDDENAINEQIEKDGFSQFKPLKDFSKSLNFNSLYDLLEIAELQWMSDSSSDLNNNPFNNIDVGRYHTALYNEYGDILINGEIYNAKSKSHAKCRQIGHTSGETPTFVFENKKRLIHGYLSTTTLSLYGSTTLYNVKDNGRKTLWFSTVSIFIEGSKSGGCEDLNPGSDFHPNSRELRWGCFVSACSLRGTGPTYIVPGHFLHSNHEASKAGQSLDLYL